MFSTSSSVASSPSLTSPHIADDGDSPTVREMTMEYHHDGFRPLTPTSVLLEELANTAKTALSISRTPILTPTTAMHHSRHASVESRITLGTEDASDEGSSSEYSRASTPVSMTNTFGGAQRASSFRYRLSHASTEVSDGDDSSRQLQPKRSDSFTSQTSRASSSVASTAVPSRYRHRHSLPAPSLRSSSHTYMASTVAVVTTDMSQNSTAHSGMDKTRSLAHEWVADQALRMSPGVVGMGEGWAGGPQHGRNKRRIRWFRRGKGWTEQIGREDPLALWTVMETEEKISPLKSVWNRSRAKFGASTPALLAESPSKRATRSRSMFSLNRADPASSGRRGSEPTLLQHRPHPESQKLQAVPQLSVDPPHFDPFWSELYASGTEGQPQAHRLSVPTWGPSYPSTRRSSMSFGTRRHLALSQPRLPPPRSASLPANDHAGLTASASTSVSASAVEIDQDLTLSRMETFGCNTPPADPIQRGGAGEAALDNINMAEMQLDQSTEEQRNNRRADTRTWLRSYNLKQRLSNFAIEFGTSKTAKPPHDQPDDTITVTAGAPTTTASAHQRLRPVSMIPLASGDEETARTQKSDLTRSRSGNLCSLIDKLGRRRSAHLPSTDIDHKIQDEPAARSALASKRRSFTLSIPSFHRWSFSQNDLLRSDDQGGGTDPLDDLIAQLRNINPPARGHGAAESVEPSPATREDAFAATKRSLFGAAGTPDPTLKHGARKQSVASTAPSADTLLLTPSKRY